MRVTIISDASCSTDLQYAAYAFWAVSSRAKLAHSGPLKEPVGSTAEAEVKAVMNAVHIAKRAGVLCDGDDLLIQVDALGAIHALTGVMTKSRTKLKYARYLKAFQDATQAHGIRVEFRHVKGHTKAETHGEARFRAQRNVDKAARTAMRNARTAGRCDHPASMKAAG